MFRRLSERYVVLQEHIPVADREAMERVLVNVMVPVAPSRVFVDRLSHDLVEEARRQHAVQQRRTSHVLRLFGILGGVLSVVGGVVLWVVLRQERDPDAEHKPLFPARTPSAMPRSA